MRQRIRVAIADREVAFGAGVAAILPREEFEVVCCGAGAGCCRHEGCEVVLIDERLLTTCRPALPASARVGALTEEPSVSSLSLVLERGVDAVVPRAVSAERLLEIVRTLAAGDPYLPPELVSALIERLRSRTRRPRTLNGCRVLLTRRQAEIVDLHEQGLSTDAIAERLSLSPVTIRRHLSDAHQTAARAGAH